MVTFTLCIITLETVDVETKIYLLISAEIKSVKPTTRVLVTGTGTETSRTCKQYTNDLWMFLGSQNLCFLKWWALVLGSEGNDFAIFFRSNDVDLDVLHDEIKLNNEVTIFT